MVEYVKKPTTSSTAAKTALGFGIAGTAIGLLNGGANLINPAAAFGVPRVSYGAPAVTVAPAPFVAEGGCGYVSDKEMCLIRENSGKDAVIAQLSAEKYADNLVEARTAPLIARICNLETAEAVNAARDQDFRRYVEREFVHQPKASMRESIVVCKQCGCECDCNHGHC